MDDKSGAFPRTSQDLHDAVEAVKRSQPSFFKLEAQLPTQGRTNLPMAASENMWVVLKTYASGGENELHTHPHEDHTFLVLQGAAKFYGPAGEIKIIGKNEGVLLPAGAYYWFHCCSEEPLVMARVGAGTGSGQRFGRLDIDGNTMQGDDPRNREEAVILSDQWYGKT